MGKVWCGGGNKVERGERRSFSWIGSLFYVDLIA